MKLRRLWIATLFTVLSTFVLAVDPASAGTTPSSSSCTTLKKVYIVETKCTAMDAGYRQRPLILCTDGTSAYGNWAANGSWSMAVCWSGERKGSAIGMKKFPI